MYKELSHFNIDHLIKIRLHLGHKDTLLNKKINSYLYGTRHNINIYDINKLWKSFRYLFYNFSELFAVRSSFFIVGTNQNLPMEKLLKNLMKTYPFSIEDSLKQEITYNSFYISGFVDKKWIGGLFSNWNIFYDFIDYLQNYSFTEKTQHRFQKYFYYLQGISNLQKMPIPDFILMLNKDVTALKEIKQLEIPMIGLVDTDMDPDDFIYKFFSNNDSIETIEFLFTFLNETAKEGRLKEQEKFLFYLILKIKKKLYQSRRKKYGKKNKI